MVCSVGRYGDRGHDGDIAGGVELSAEVGLGPRGRKRPGEKGETIWGLTAELQGWLVGSDTSWGGCGHDHAMDGGEKLSAAVEEEARG